MPVCFECERDRDDGYRRDPFTGALMPSLFWCRTCYEELAGRAQWRPAGDSTLPAKDLMSRARDRKKERGPYYSPCHRREPPSLGS